MKELMPAEGYDFLDLSHLDFTWELTLNGLLLERGTLPEITAQAQCEQSLEAPKPAGDVPGCRFGVPTARGQW